MATMTIEAKGLKCPVPVLKVTTAVMKKEVKPGDVLEVVADCPSFEADIRKWCADSKKILVWFRDEGNNVKRCQIQI